MANERPTLLHEVDDEVQIDTVHGFRMYVSRRSGMGQTLIGDGQWEPLLSRTIKVCLRRGDWAVDVGANIGYDSLIMSHAVGANGIVFAFEPEPENLALLLRNMHQCSSRNIVVHSLALSDTPAIARISLRDPYYTGQPNLRSESADSSRPVLAMRLDALLQPSSEQRIRFAKLDVEGFEYKVILGMGDLIDRVDFLSSEINDDFLAQCGSTGEELFAYMKQRGFDALLSPAQSGGQWIRVDSDAASGVRSSTHLDVLFYRELDAALRPLIA